MRVTAVIALEAVVVLTLGRSCSWRSGKAGQKQQRADEGVDSRRHLQSSTYESTPLPDCSSESDVDIWSDSERLHAGHLDDTRGGCITLTEIYNALLDDDGEPTGPLYIMDDDDNKLEDADETPTGRWLLTDELYIEDGVTLKVWGVDNEVDEEGDADVLRLESNKDYYFNLRGYGGSLSFISTTVTSWDTSKGEVRDYHEKGRSYISCISEVPTDDDCRGEEKDKGECRMDILHSEMGYLGHKGAEAYGLTWKVRGLCEDKSDPDFPVNENEDLFDKVNVWGDIKFSDIHHMYYGMYSFGHEGGNWSYNIMRDNDQYGFDPHDDSDNLIISHNDVYGNGNHGIIASKRCNNVQVFNNLVYNNEKSGIYFHRGCHESAAYNNYVHDNKDTGLSIMESSNCSLHNNIVENHDVGVRIVIGGEFNEVYDNTFDGCDTYAFLTYESERDFPWTSDGRSSDNVFSNNVVSNTERAIGFKNGDRNVVIGNDFTDTEQFVLDDSYDIQLKDNTYPSDACLKAEDFSFTDDSEVPDEC